MADQSKTLRAAYESFDRTKKYSLEEAVKLMVKNAKVKFDATAEIHFTLGIDPKHADQMVRTVTTLPHGTGKKVRVVVFCDDGQVKAAKAAGAVAAGDKELIDKVAAGWTDFDVAVSTPAAMKDLGKIARVLGPKGLMPNPKAGTVTDDITKAVTELVAGRIELRNDKVGVVHTVFGKLSFGEKKLHENLKAIMEALKGAKPNAIKSDYIKSVTINSTMGPGIKLEF